MDRMIYTAMTGAKHILEQQATTAHNLANATSTGFKAQVIRFEQCLLSVKACQRVLLLLMQL